MTTQEKKKNMKYEKPKLINMSVYSTAAAGACGPGGSATGSCMGNGTTTTGSCLGTGFTASMGCTANGLLPFG
jgi:hypothetical protein